MKAHHEALIYGLLLFCGALILALCVAISQCIETRKQRDEAYELARKAQNSAQYWYDVHEKMVWHTQPNEETK